VHELSLAQAILDTVQQQAASHGASRVLSIRLRIGELSAVVDEALTFSLGIIGKGTAAEGCAVTIEHVPWVVRCAGCGIEYRVEGGLPVCPACRTPGGATLTGHELQIVEMDIE
jgi:hydrogenase nickel incorporation protein HypA/HybF